MKSDRIYCWKEQKFNTCYLFSNANTCILLTWIHTCILQLQLISNNFSQMDSKVCSKVHSLLTDCKFKTKLDFNLQTSKWTLEVRWSKANFVDNQVEVRTWIDPFVKQGSLPKDVHANIVDCSLHGQNIQLHTVSNIIDNFVGRGTTEARTGGYSQQSARTDDVCLCRVL